MTNRNAGGPAHDGETRLSNKFPRARAIEPKAISIRLSGGFPAA